MVELLLPKNSKITKGKIFGKKTKESICFNIYRWNRESGKTPSVDKFYIEKKKLGPMALDALLYILKMKSTQLLLLEDLVGKVFVVHAQ